MEKGKCIHEGCCEEVYGYGARGADVSITKYCRKHYRWLKERGTLEPPRNLKGTLEERFWHKVEKSNIFKCWEWLGPKNGKGYGVITAPPTEKNKRGKALLAHRVSYEIDTGTTIPNGEIILHICDNPSCVNPHHLTMGSQSENIKDAFDKGRKIQPILTGENNPKSKLTAEQAKYIKDHPEMRLIDLADMFGLSPNCIRGVRIGRTWKDIT